MKESTLELKGKLNAAFADLRKACVVAKQNFSCCGGCMVGELYDLLRKFDAIADSKKRPIGWVAYHNQANARLKDDENFCIMFGWNRRDLTEPQAKQDADDVVIGHVAMAIFRTHEIPCEWSGKADDAIRVLVK